MMICLFVAVSLYANSITCKVVNVSDGDTVTVLCDKNDQIKLRLFGIDAPEKKQAYGQKSKQALSSMIAAQEVQIVTHGHDRYSRTIATIFLNDVDINAEQVKNGMAWAYVKYSKKYVLLEEAARKERVGLWNDNNPTPPWEWRKK